MKSPLLTLLFGAALGAAAVPALAQTNVSINIGQPGFYGRVELGDFAPPPVVYVQQPVIVREVRHVYSEPVYLRVPTKHRKNWSRYCDRYDACGRPVMFVRDDWYTDTYAPRYRERHYAPRPVVREVREVRHVVHHVDYDDRRERRERHDRHDKHDKHDKHDRHDRHDRHDKHDKHGKGHGKGHGRDD
ncbi:hypothetical protein ACFPOU_16735 [Massilia jejuensis]|uniref:Uncharacterized protein n=1 Tax=Massilia jejuensis TaxID=648894 RepID=A0ABW0PL00_9BURK